MSLTRDTTTAGPSTPTALTTRATTSSDATSDPARSEPGKGNDIYPLVIACVICCGLFSAIFTVLRVYVRKKVKMMRLGYDDWLICTAVLGLWNQGWLAIWAGSLGWANIEHDLYQETANSPKLSKISLGIQLSYTFTCPCIQLCIIATTLRIASAFLFYRLASAALATLCVAIAIARIVGTSGRIIGIWYIAVWIHLCLDILVWLLPFSLLFWIWRKGPRISPTSATRDIAGVIALFGMGLVACGVAAARIGANLVDRNGLPPPGVQAWSQVYLLMLDQLELGVGIVCANMPTLKPLMQKRMIVETFIKPVMYWFRGEESSGKKLSGSLMLRRRGSGGGGLRIGADHDPQPGNSGWGSRIARERERKEFEAQFEFGKLSIGRGPRGEVDLDVEGLGVLDRPPPIQRFPMASLPVPARSLSMSLSPETERAPPVTSVPVYPSSSRKQQHLVNSSTRTLHTIADMDEVHLTANGCPIATSHNQASY